MVFLMTVFANYSAKLIADFLPEKTSDLGGIILIFIGIYNLIKKDDSENNNGGLIKQSLITGFAVGLDGACANLSLSIMGLNAFYVPVVISLMHAVTITLGILLSKTSVMGIFNKIGFLSPLILIILGSVKTAAFFI